MPNTARITSYCTDRKWIGRADCSHCSIRHLMLFSSLPEDSFTHLLKPIDNFTLEPGSILYKEADTGEVVYSIRRGLVKLLHPRPDGQQRIVRLLGQGAVVGLELLDTGVAYQHSAVALQPVDVCAIPISTLRDLEIHHPELCDRVRQQLQCHVDRADHLIRVLNTGVARDRIAQLLLLLAELAPDRNGDIGLPPRDDIAAVVGVTPETSSRIIAEFRRQNLLNRIAANTYRLDKQQLQQLCRQPPQSR